MHVKTNNVGTIFSNKRGEVYAPKLWVNGGCNPTVGWLAFKIAVKDGNERIVRLGANYSF